MPGVYTDPWEEQANMPAIGFAGGVSGTLSPIFHQLFSNAMASAYNQWSSTPAGSDKPSFWGAMGAGAQTGVSDISNWLTGQPTSTELQLHGVKALLAGAFQKVIAAALAGGG